LAGLARSGGRGESDFLVGAIHGDTALGGAGEVALHDEVRFVDFFEGAGFFADGDGEGVEADGAAAKTRTRRT
jgi:hypothetical protein